jgi:hypothetical protein
MKNILSLVVQSLTITFVLTTSLRNEEDHQSTFSKHSFLRMLDKKVFNQAKCFWYEPNTMSVFDLSKLQRNETEYSKYFKINNI